MMLDFGPELVAVVLGLASAACWGAADFSGGVASKRGSSYSVVIASQIIGIMLLGVLILPLPEPLPSAESLLWAAAAGISGGFGLVAFYRALADGQMGVVAPVGAIVGTLVPVIAAFFIDGFPGIVTLVGFGVAMAAVWLVSSGDEQMSIHLRELGLPVLAGISFGGFLLFISRASETALLWPLIAARAASLVTLSVVGMALGQLQVPDRKQLPAIALAGIFDTGGNALYALATRAGRLDIAAVLGSIYPGGTVLLAWLILKERLTRLQWVGVGTTLVAIALIAV